ncbi:hypothetical protein Pfo_006246, partial [Paulownia fortunei]
RNIRLPAAAEKPSSPFQRRCASVHLRVMDSGAINPYATWTECIGYESMSEEAKCGDLTEYTVSPSRSRAGEAVRMRGRKMAHLGDLPPLLPGLSKDGRWRFRLVKQRENGRLTIEMVEIGDC